MNLKGYILKFGNRDFISYPFNDIDGALFGFLSYANWELYAPSTFDPSQDGFSFSDLTDSMVDRLVKDTPTPNSHKKLLKAIIKTKRYKNVIAKYIEYKFDYERKQQYYAMTFDIPFVGSYVSFRGTDLSILGWEEDFRMALNIVTNAQSDSVEYLRKVSKLIDGNFFVGGHSKGGNMALYASVKVDKKIQDHIIKVYSLDGPGFYDNAFLESESYKNIERKVFQIIPKDSYVGIIFNTPKNYKIVSSRNASIFQHIAYSWRVKKDGTFRYKDHRTYMSYVRQRALVKWLENVSYDDKLLIIESLVTTLGGRDKTLLFYLKHPTWIGRTFTYWHKKFNKAQKKLLNKYSRKLLSCYMSSFFYCLNKNHRKDPIE